MSKGSELVPVEARKHQRLGIRLPGEIVFADGTRYRIVTRNISFGGAFVVGAALRLRRGEPCQLYLSPEVHWSKASKIELRGCVVHNEADGTAVRFVIASLHAYRRFVELMVAHSPEPEWLVRELEGAPGFVRDIA